MAGQSTKVKGALSPARREPAVRIRNIGFRGVLGDASHKGIVIALKSLSLQLAKASYVGKLKCVAKNGVGSRVTKSGSDPDDRAGCRRITSLWYP